MGLWLRWLERAPDKGEVTGSSPVRPTIFCPYSTKPTFLVLSLT